MISGGRTSNRYLGNAGDAASLEGDCSEIRQGQPDKGLCLRDFGQHCLSWKGSAALTAAPAGQWPSTSAIFEMAHIYWVSPLVVRTGSDRLGLDGQVVEVSVVVDQDGGDGFGLGLAGGVPKLTTA